MAAVDPLEGTCLFSRPVCLVEAEPSGEQLSAVTPDTQQLGLRLLLVDQGLEFDFNLATVRSSWRISTYYGAGTPTSDQEWRNSQPSDDGQVRDPGHVPGTGHGALL